MSFDTSRVEYERALKSNRDSDGETEALNMNSPVRTYIDKRVIGIGKIDWRKLDGN